MPFLVLIIGGVLLVAAIRDTHGELMAALRQDVPAFALWGAAIFGIAMIGYIPGLKPVSRGLMALLIVVIVLTNYKPLLAAFQGVAYGAPAQAAGGGSAPDNSRLLASLVSLGGSAFQDNGSDDGLGGITLPNYNPPTATTGDTEAAYLAAVAEGSKRTRT